MNKTFQRHTVTAALPYANGPKHLGHLAGAYLPADVYVRYLRAIGQDVVFVSGSDEHGTAIANQALREGTTPQAIIDKYHALNRDAFQQLGISFDIYHRTSEPLHHQTAQEFFLRLYETGNLVAEETEQYFDEEAGKFLADRYIMGTCPKCSNEKAYGDQCERCGTELSPTELLNPHSLLSGKAPVLRKTTNWFLPMDKLESGIVAYLEGHPEWKSHVLGQCRSWISDGLKPRAMTRDLDWGVQVPLPEGAGKVLYVWFDAPIGYISATKQWAADHGKDWKLYWQDPGTRLVHFIGKDNIVFHCITFPMMLMAHGGYVLPDQVPANEFMNLEGDKMSTSRQWSIEMDEYLRAFPGKEDVLRYYLLSILPESKDSEFTWKDYQARNNNELVAILGNFVNRSLVLTQKYFNGVVPAAHEYTREDLLLMEEAARFPERIGAALEAFRFREALQELMNLARLGNKYLADTEPWKLMQSDEKRVRTVLNLALQLSASLSTLMEPFLPFTAERLRSMLRIGKLSWTQAGNLHHLGEGHVLDAPFLLFDKVDDETVARQVEALHAKKAALPAEAHVAQPQKPETTFEAFNAMDLRVATIVAAERVPKTDKLLKLTVDTGLDKRTVVSGIAEWFNPDTLPGTRVLILINLAPRKIKGIESNGMILLAENARGQLAMVPQLTEDMENGAVVK